MRICRVAAFLVLALASTGLRGDDRILFIGNSFTYGAINPVVVLGGGVPQMVSDIAEAKGRKITTKAVTKGGEGWDYHLAQPVTATALAAGWTWVVLQDYSLRPTRVGNVASFLNDGEMFSDRIVAASPKAGILLYETWARPAGKFYGNRADWGPEQMMADLHANYAKLRNDLAARHADTDVRVAEVGTAFARCQAEFPSINLSAVDAHHSTPAGYYLAAMVIYERIYHESAVGAPTSLYHGTIRFKSDEATDLQKVADEVAGAVAKN